MIYSILCSGKTVQPVEQLPIVHVGGVLLLLLLLRRSPEMGRLVAGPYTTNKNLTNTALENNLDVFHYLPSTYNGCAYVEQDRVKPGRWKDKQLGVEGPKKAPSHGRVRDAPTALQPAALHQPRYQPHSGRRGRSLPAPGSGPHAPTHAPEDPARAPQLR
jgi:hypothetical protein